MLQTKFGPIDVLAALPTADVVELIIDMDQGLPLWLVRVACPYCPRIHQHGGGNEDTPLLGSRVPHCPNSGEYVLTITSETKTTVRDGSE